MVSAEKRRFQIAWPQKALRNTTRNGRENAEPRSLLVRRVPPRPCSLKSKHKCTSSREASSKFTPSLQVSSSTLCHLPAFSSDNQTYAWNWSKVILKWFLTPSRKSSKGHSYDPFWEHQKCHLVMDQWCHATKSFSVATKPPLWEVVASSVTS